MSNIGRAVIKKLAVKFEGNEIMSVDDFDVLVCYRDLWKTKSEKRNTKKGEQPEQNKPHPQVQPQTNNFEMD